MAVADDGNADYAGCSAGDERRLAMSAAAAYSNAAMSSNARKPSQSESDSMMPPASAPRRFAPIAPASKPLAAKRLMKTIPAQMKTDPSRREEADQQQQNRDRHHARRQSAIALIKVRPVVRRHFDMLDVERRMLADVIAEPGIDERCVDPLLRAGDEEVSAARVDPDIRPHMQRLLPKHLGHQIVQTSGDPRPQHREAQNINAVRRQQSLARFDRFARVDIVVDADIREVRRRRV